MTQTGIGSDGREGRAPPALSVVLIARDQAWNIGRLIESVQRELAPLPSKQVLLVDSGSRDATVEEAVRHPIDILRMELDQPLTPSAARYVGYQQTAGELVLFLDGDMELCEGWLPQALRIAEARPDIAVLTGPIVDVDPAAVPAATPPAQAQRGATLRDIAYSAGAAMHRRSVLDEVGSFNPYLHSDEEPELCIRVRRAGYRVAELTAPIAYHYSRPSDAISTLVARWRRKLFLGTGQAIRYHLGSRVLWDYVRERGYGLPPALGLGTGIAAVLGSRGRRSNIWLTLWCGALLTVVAVFAARERNLYRTSYSLLHRLLILDGTIRGFLLAPQDPRTYPGRFEIVQRMGTP